MNGTYAGLGLYNQSAKALQVFSQFYNFENPVPLAYYHCTLLHSRTFLPNYSAAGTLERGHKATPLWFRRWGTDIVLVLFSNSIQQRHKSLMEEHNGTYDYPQYKPHITLSKNEPDINIEKLNQNMHLLPDRIFFNNEYQEDLS